MNKTDPFSNLLLLKFTGKDLISASLGAVDPLPHLKRFKNLPISTRKGKISLSIFTPPKKKHHLLHHKQAGAVCTLSLAETFPTPQIFPLVKKKKTQIRAFKYIIR